VDEQKTLQVAELSHGEVAGEHSLHAFLAADPNTDVSRCTIHTNTSQHSNSHLHHVSKKLQNSFCQKFVKFPPNLTIFGTPIAQRTGLCEVHLFSTSPN